MGRFINADSLVSTGQGLLGNNMFAYCNNNPVNLSDPNGELATLVLLGAIIGGAIAGAVIGAASTVVSSKMNESEITSEDVWKAAGTGAVTGGIGGLAGAVGGTVAVIGAASAGFISGVVTACNVDGTIDQKIFVGAIAGTIAGLGTFIGTKFPIALENAFSATVTSFTGGLYMGTQTEMINVASQVIVGGMFSRSSKVVYFSCNRITAYAAVTQKE